MVIANEKVTSATNGSDKGPAEKIAGIEKIERARETGIRFIQLQFTDIIGHVKAVTIPIHQLEGSVRHGTWFDGSSIEGFTRIAESDQYLMPDMSTFSEIPWQKASGPRGTARVICDVFTPDVISTHLELKRASAKEVALRPHPYEFYLYSEL